MTYLPDVNVWIALTVSEHVHHPAARRWFEGTEKDIVAFCRITQIGFLRLLTNPKIMQQDVFKTEQAWRLLRALEEDDRIVFLGEPAAIDQTWRKITAHHKSGTNFWTDTYLAAFAQASNHTMVTFDMGFKKYRSVSLRLLTGDE